MSATLNLYVNTFTKALMQGERSAVEFILPFFSQGDMVPMTVKFLQPSSTNPFAFELPDIAALSMSLSVETAAGGVPFVSQPSWAKDTPNNRFTANVDFGTAELTSWLTGATGAGLLKIRLGAVTMIEKTITIRQNKSGANPAAPTPGTRTLTWEEADQLFLRKYALPGDTLTLRTVDGTAGRIIGIRKDGTEVIDQDEHVSI